MALYEYAHDLDTPVHPVSAPDYMPRAQLRALQLHRLQASCGFVGASRLGRAVRQLLQAPESAMAQRQFEAAASALLRR